MKRRLLIAVILVLAACGDSGSTTSTDAATSSTTTSSDATTTSVAATTTTTEQATTTTVAENPGAAAWFDPEYLSVGPGSGFVPLDDPVMVPASTITWLQPDSIVLGVVHPSGEAHAFPADMMAYHHIANTTIAGEPYLVTY